MSSLDGNGARATSSPEQLMSYLFYQTHLENHLAGIEYRQRLLGYWNIPSGSSVLEIGCGQGEFTVCLADAVGPTGRVVAVDPAPPGWGTPCVIEAQNYLAASPIGSRVTFINDTAPNYVLSLKDDTPRFDYVLLGHCVWFFEKPHMLQELMETLQPWTRSVLIAEFSFSTSMPTAFPHVLAAQYNSTVEALLSDREEWNIRSPLTPGQMTLAGERAGFKLASEKVISPGEQNREGSREVRMLLKAKEFENERLRVEQRHGPRVAVMLNALKDVIAKSVEQLEGGIEAVRNMDVWLAKFDVADNVL